MKKLLNNPWVVGLLAALAIVFVTHTAMKDDGYDYASGDSWDETEDWSEEEADSYGETSAPANGTSIWEALDALTPSTPPTDPFSHRPANVLVGTTAEEETTAPLVSVHLSAIWKQGEQTLLLVNDRIHASGDTVVELAVGDLSIESASLDGIWLSHPAGQHFLSLGNTFNWDTAGHTEAPNPTLALHEN